MVGGGSVGGAGCGPLGMSLPSESRNIRPLGRLALPVMVNSPRWWASWQRGHRPVPFSGELSPEVFPMDDVVRLDPLGVGATRPSAASVPIEDQSTDMIGEGAHGAPEVHRGAFGFPDGGEVAVAGEFATQPFGNPGALPDPSAFGVEVDVRPESVGPVAAGVGQRALADLPHDLAPGRRLAGVSEEAVPDLIEGLHDAGTGIRVPGKGEPKLPVGRPPVGKVLGGLDHPSRHGLDDVILDRVRVAVLATAAGVGC